MKLSAGVEGLSVRPDVPSGLQYIHPGQTLTTREPKRLTTILGSCVAVCLWDAASRVGGMNHYLIAEWLREGPGSDRYGNIAMESLIRGMREHGARLAGLRAGVYGGAAVLQAFRETAFRNLGMKNADIARDILRQHRIPIADEQTGGDASRKIVFDTADGHVAVSRIGAPQ